VQVRASPVGLDEGSREVRRLYNVPGTRVMGSNEFRTDLPQFDVPGAGTGIYTGSSSRYLQANTLAASSISPGGRRISTGPSEIV
jgi:hypothetical protein